MIRICCLSLIAFTFFSCTSTRKLTYLQSGIDSTGTFFSPVRNVYKIRAGDQLYVDIKTTDAVNTTNFNHEGTGNPYNTISVYLNSYLVNDSGDIKLPVIGDLRVSGLSVHEATALIQQSAARYIKESTIYVKLTDFEISVLGEVKNPGVVQVHDENVTLLKALSISGDLNDWANRKKINIYRKSGVGYDQYTVDLTRDDLLHSDVFYLFPGDIVYVAPSRMKAVNINLSTWRTLIVGLSALSVILKVLNTY